MGDVMSAVVNTLLPIFALIFIGFLFRKLNFLGENSASELNRFVVWLCLPALLFKATASANYADLWQPEFILVITIPMMLVFAATLVYRKLCKVATADASIDGLSAAYANFGYVGIPLCLLVFGEEGLQPALISTLLVVCVLFSVAVVCIEIAIQNEASFILAVKKVALALIKNPLVVSPFLGIFWNTTQIGVAPSVLQFLTLLGSATTPCALVSLGLFLAHKQPKAVSGTASIVFIKLIIHPIIAWVLAFHVFKLPDLWAKSAVLLSALPTGTGPYMLAEFYRRDAALVSRSVLFSTLGSVVTLSVLLLLFAD
ncbi:AEC family transporter [Sessilibacter sp. MAH4]